MVVLLNVRIMVSCFLVFIKILFLFQTIPILFLDLAPTPAQLYGGNIVCDICSKTYVRVLNELLKEKKKEFTFIYRSLLHYSLLKMI